MQKDQNTPSPLIAYTAEIVSAYLSHHQMPAEKVYPFIEQIYYGLHQIESPFFSTRSLGSEPAVPLENSITPDYLVCLEDGKQMKMLKRYLLITYNMTPEQYRKRWSLPPNYPMVAPNYTKRRSSIAKEIGFGKKGGRKKKVA